MDLHQHYIVDSTEVLTSHYSKVFDHPSHLLVKKGKNVTFIIWNVMFRYVGLEMSNGRVGRVWVCPNGIEKKLKKNEDEEEESNTKRKNRRRGLEEEKSKTMIRRGRIKHEEKTQE
ncbi:hypothetical protein YC2023_086967 [Brassica napus]